MRRFGLACSVLAAQWLVGCSLLLPPKPEPVTAILDKMPGHVPTGVVHPDTLLVRSPETSAAFDTTRMAYSVKAYQLAYFRDNQWAETPAQMIQPLLVRTLQQTGFFRAILSPPESETPSYSLRTEILELIQDHTTNPPVVRLKLHLQLFQASGWPIASRDIVEQEAMANAVPYAGVVAANDVVAKALRTTAQFVTSVAR
ncbi:MAG TPA: ABC-type transport auxiliary lipoprotein family protein, partial [Acetobacteraceae bacterium]|jgi:cholesterol transport system auxiliary component|nr:ABC-type transport auxiliary lipoprotein family protein [Acetobacteraceae bacterium]